MICRVLVSTAEPGAGAWRRLKRVCARHLANMQVMERLHVIAGEIEDGRIAELRAAIAPAEVELEGTIPPPPGEGPR